MSQPSNIADNGARSNPRDPHPPTVAAFSPTTIAGSSLTSRQHSSVIVHRKSPLLVATPPPITRALAHSHPFLLPLNKLAGLLTWSSGDSWASFLVVAGFWAIVLYSDAIILYAGPILVVAGLILGMYTRRYSPLSSTGVTGERHGHNKNESPATRHQKSLDEIVETMREFTTRCNVLLGPLREMTDFLSTQSSATTATTRPALTSLLIRIICVTPIWILLTLPPFYIITTRRVVLSVGTIILTYHSRPARVFRVLLWRSLTIRRICAFLTGLKFSTDKAIDKASGGVNGAAHSSRGLVTAIAKSSSGEGGIRFTFIVYENQRRWIGIGWTYSLFPHERSAWTDEHMNTVPPKDIFELPDARGGNAAWRWVEGSQWQIDGGDDTSDGGGWIYYDNKWQDGRRGDSWGRYTRRRKWYRDAELVEITKTDDPVENLDKVIQDDSASIKSVSTVTDTPGSVRKRRWFSGSNKTASPSASTVSAPPAINPDAANNPDSATSSNPEKPTTVSSSPPSSNSPRPSRPGTLHRSRTSDTGSKPGSQYGGSSSPGQGSVSSSSLRRTTTGETDGDDRDSQKSLRDREIEDAQNRHDRWGARASGGTERAERELGLGDDVNMGLS